MLPQSLTLRGRSFDRICIRQTRVGVYRGDGTYLRIGPGLATELAVHRRMARRGFPVARVLEYGYLRGLPYFVEESLGSTTLGDLFALEVSRRGAVSDEVFDSFREVMGHQALAQVRMARVGWSARGFADLVGVARAAALHPVLGDAIRDAFERATSRLEPFPGTLLHADLHPDNTCTGGVIDVENAGWGVVGYDVVTAVFVPAMCQSEPPVGATPDAGFSSAQLRRYLRTMDDVFATFGSGPVSGRLDALLLCRAISLCSRRHRDPDVWAMRRHLLRSTLDTVRRGDDLGARWGLATP